MDSTCIEKNTFPGIRLIGQKYQAKLVSEPAKLLGAWRQADSRTGLQGDPKTSSQAPSYASLKLRLADSLTDEGKV